MTDSDAEKRKNEEKKGIMRMIKFGLIIFGIIVGLALIYFFLVVGMGVKDQRLGYGVSVSEGGYDRTTMSRTRTNK
jgi:hypothetical protein